MGLKGLESKAESSLVQLSCRRMWKTIRTQRLWLGTRQYSRIRPPPPAGAQPIIRVSNNIAHLGGPKEGPKPRQLLSLPPFPGLPLPGKNPVRVPGRPPHVTAISWVKYYFDEVYDNAIQSHFNKGLVSFISFIYNFFFLKKIMILFAILGF